MTDWTMQLATLTNRRPSERLDLLRLRDTKEVIIDDFIVCFLASDAALVPNSDQSIFLTQNHIFLRIPPSRRTLSAYDESSISAAHLMYDLGYWYVVAED